MAQLSLSKAWEDTRAIFARDGSLLTAVALALFVLPQIIVGLVTPSVGAAVSTQGRVIWIIGALIGLVGQLALVRLAVGPSTAVGQAIQHGARRFLPTIGAFLILVAAMALVLVPLMIVLFLTGTVQIPVEGQPPPPSFAALAAVIALASVLVSVKFALSVAISSTEQVGPLQILKRSWTLTRGHYWRILAFVLMLVVTALVLGIVAQSVGGIFAELIGDQITPFSLGALVIALLEAIASAVVSTLFSVMLARIYLQLAGREAQTSVPSSGI
jgi:Membrane domain of glycerophosphoryl diester phosphodiesterase